MKPTVIIASTTLLLFAVVVVDADNDLVPPHQTAFIPADECNAVMNPYAEYYHSSVPLPSSTPTRTDSDPSTVAEKLGATSKHTQTTNIPLSSLPPIANGSTAPPEQNKDFFWTGGDVDTSVQLSDNYTLFVYGDTLMGGYNSSSNARTCADVFGGGTPAGCSGWDIAYMPHSSFGILDHNTKKMKYFWGENGYSILTPPWAERGNLVFWATAATPIFHHNNNDHHGNNSEFCFLGMWIAFLQDRTNGTWVVCLELNVGRDEKQNNVLDPKSWKQRWVKWPGTGYNWTSYANFNFHSSVYHVDNDEKESRNTTVNTSPEDSSVSPKKQKINKGDDWLYIFGIMNPIKGGNMASKQLLVRLPWSSLLNFSFKGLELWNGVNIHTGEPVFSREGNASGKFSGDPAPSIIDVDAGYRPVRITESEVNGTSLADYSEIEYLWGPANPEFTIVYSKLLQRYIIFVLGWAYGAHMYYMMGKNLEGPWSDIIAVQAILPATGDYFSELVDVNGTSMTRWQRSMTDGNIGCYANKIHPSLTNPNNLSQGLFIPPAAPTAPTGNENHSGSSNLTERRQEAWITSFVCNTQSANVAGLYAANYSSVYVPYFSFMSITTHEAKGNSSHHHQQPVPHKSKKYHQPKTLLLVLLIGVSVMVVLLVVMLVVWRRRNQLRRREEQVSLVDNPAKLREQLQREDEEEVNLVVE